jgi:hypothetical protein
VTSDDIRAVGISAVSFQLKTLRDLRDHFATFAFKHRFFNRKGRKEGAKVAKVLKLSDES